jgi:methionyl aminopeptidase
LKNIEIPVYTAEDLDGLRKSGQIVAKVLWEMINVLKPGISTKKLDDVAGKILRQLDSRSAPKLEGFPGNTCISVNEIIAHGIPNKKVLKCGDRVNIDVSAEHNGYFGDVATTVILGEQKHESNGLLDCARQATLDAVSMSLPGTPFNAIGKHIEDLARVHDFTIIRNLCSHGVGKSLHTHPQNILNYYDADETMKLTEGMVIAWEPYLSTCACRAIEVKDNDWNLTTHNQSEVAQFEHTVLVTQGAPEILTLLK